MHEAYFAAGGVSVLIGDGQLPSDRLEQIIETHYSYALSSSTKLSFDYQFIANPAYNTQRGPVNVFAGRLHTHFWSDRRSANFCLGGSVFPARANALLV